MEELLRRWSARRDGETFEGDIETNNRQVHHNILTSAGIDPTIEPWVSYINLGIKDDDPTRVLKECQHKSISAHPVRSVVLDRLALERANPKIIHCGVYSYAIGGPDLDGIDEQFKQRYCNSCADKVPRPAGSSFYGDDPENR